uniref:Uncharacterized protein LOC100373858 n=1 Tax=Saccoglossus kowalevskii TaxID=10224 RepID=A0ABM0GN39_SACKO|nr:PREDICTED: uncharacterized protein LOC100373858 [Saccoglossus kowalevskii]
MPYKLNKWKRPKGYYAKVHEKRKLSKQLKAEEHTSTCISNISDLQKHVGLVTLPSNWSVLKSPTEIRFSQIEFIGDESTVSRCVMVGEDLTWQVKLHGRYIPKNHSIFEGISSAVTDVDMVTTLISEAVKCKMCPGNFDQSYIDLVRGKGGEIVKATSLSGEKTSSDSKVNLRFLSPTELRERASNLQKEKMTLKRSLSRTVKQLVSSEGIAIDGTLQSDFKAIMEENNHDVQKVCRSSGFVKLPSQRTLTDYSNYIKPKPGISQPVLKELISEIECLGSSESNKYVVLLHDEMKVKQDLVYDKNTGELIGFTNLGDINEELMKLENGCHIEKNKGLGLASHVLVLMVRGLASSLQMSLGYFPTVGCKSDNLYPIIWDTIT